MSSIWITIVVLYALMISQMDAVYVPLLSSHNDTKQFLANGLESVVGPFLTGRAPSTNDPYVWQNFYELHQFDSAPTVNGVNQRTTYESMVHTSILHCMAIFLSARNVLETQIATRGSQLPDNPSLLRYGPTNTLGGTWLPIARDFVHRWLDVLGWAPMDGTNTRAQCLPQIDKLQFWYEDPPAAALPPGQGCAGISGKVGYFFLGQNGHKNGIVFCHFFFTEYRSLDSLDPSQFGPAIEFGNRPPLHQPTFYTAKVLLHELMHYVDVYGDFFKPFFGPDGDVGGPIDDIRLRDNYGDTWVAYGAFMALKANDPSWDWVTAGQNPTVIPAAYRNTLFNVENWVYMFTEIYLQHRYNLPDWQDPPENRQWGLKIPPPAAQRRPRAQPAPAKVAKIAATSQSSSTTEIEIVYNEVSVTRVPTRTGSFSSPTYGPQCPLCQAQPSSVSTK